MTRKQRCIIKKQCKKQHCLASLLQQAKLKGIVLIRLVAQGKMMSPSESDYITLHNIVKPVFVFVGLS